MGEQSQDKIKKESQLTYKQKMFVENYLKTGNLSKAARDAGYSPNNSSVTGQNLIKKPHISKEIDRRRSEVIEKSEIDVDLMMKRLYDIVRTPDTELFDIDAETNHLKLKGSINSLPENVRSSIRIQAELRNNQLIYRIDKLDPMAAFDRLSKCLGINEEHVTINLGKESEPADHSISESDSNAQAIKLYNEFVHDFESQPKKQ